MIDLGQLSQSLDPRSYGRLLESKHPFFELIKGRINFDNLFNVAIGDNVDKKLSKAIKMFNSDRRQILRWPIETMLPNASLGAIVKNSKLKTLLTPVAFTTS